MDAPDATRIGGAGQRTARQAARAQAIGGRIAQARKEHGGMRQEELAELISVSLRSVQAYESGEVIPYRKMRDLERVLGKSMGWILHGTDDESKDLRAIRDLLVEIRDSNNQILALLRSQQEQ